MESNCHMSHQNGRYSGNMMGTSCGQQNMRNQNCNRNASNDSFRMQNNCNNSSRTIQDGTGRSMNVNCTYIPTNSGACSMKDPLARLGDDFPIAMAYVPWQDWGDIYCAQEGLCRGTMFKELDKIFCGVRC